MKSRIAAVLCCALASTLAVFAQQNDLSRMSDDDFLRFLAERRTAQQTGATIESFGNRLPCGFDVTAEVGLRLRSMTGTRLQTLREFLAPAAAQMSIFSPSGKFRIHFDTSGSASAALLDAGGKRIEGTALQYATAVGVFFDSAYQVEVTETGYAAPPFESGATAYNIYIREYSGYYGETKQVDLLVSNTRQPLYSTFIEIDNDFAGNYQTRGLDGARVTAAHEFHHMVQMGTYGTWASYLWMHEMSSTYCEQLVFPGIHDYYQYLKEFLGKPERAFTSWGNWGYSLVLLPIMFDQKFDRSVMLRSWENMKQTEPVPSMDAALRSHSSPSDLATEYCALWRWCYFTGIRASQAVGGERFELAEEYPLAKIASDIEISGKGSFAGAIPPFSTMFFRASKGVESIAIAVTNNDLAGATASSGAGVGFQLELGPDVTGSGSVAIGNGWSYNFTSSSPGFCVSALGLIKDVVNIFPNPFHPELDGLLRFGVSKSFSSPKVTLTIWTVSMSLVGRYENMSISSDATLGRFVAWDGLGLDGVPVASGIYFYSIDGGGSIATGKFAVIRK